MVASDAAEIRFEVQLTEQDILLANRLWSRRHRRSRFGLATCCFLALVFGLIAVIRGYSAGGIALFVLMGALFYPLISYVTELGLPRIARSAHVNQPSLLLPTCYLARADGLAVSQEGYSGHFTWGQLLRWAEDAHCMILFNTSRTFLILPRRDLGEGDAVTLRRYLDGAGVPRI